MHDEAILVKNEVIIDCKVFAGYEANIDFIVIARYDLSRLFREAILLTGSWKPTFLDTVTNLLLYLVICY